MGTKFSLYAGPPLQEALAATGDDRPDGNRSGRINTVAARYLRIIADSMPAFSRAEWCAIMDANNGTYLLDEPEPTAMMLWANVADTDGLGEKWGIDRDDLVGRMRALPGPSAIAIAEAVQRFWARSELPTDEALAAAGCRLS